VGAGRLQAPKRARERHFLTSLVRGDHLFIHDFKLIAGQVLLKDDQVRA
jgi:hypothetical protein